MKLLMISASILVLISAILFLGCVGPGAEVIDCGSDLKCFQTYASNCTRVKVLIDTATMAGSVPGMSGAKIYEEVKGGTVDACSIFMKIEDITFPAGISEEQRAQAEIAMAIIRGKDMTCTMSTAEFTSLVPGEGPTPLNIEEKCSGSLVDLMKMFQTRTAIRP